MSTPSDALIERFLDALWLEAGLSRNTLSAYRSDLEGLAAWLKTPIAGASRAQLQDYLADCVGRGMRPRTTARLLSSLRRFYQYLVRENVIGEDPMQAKIVAGARNILWIEDSSKPVVTSVPTEKGEVLICLLKIKERLLKSSPNYDPAAERMMINLLTH